MKKYYFLQEDIDVLEKIIDDLRHKIRQLGKEQGEVAKQSTENFGHDDACQEVVYYDRQLMVGRLNELRDTLNHAVVVSPKTSSEVRLGTTVTLDDGRTLKIGSYMTFAKGNMVKVSIISYNSPLGNALLGKTEGDEISFQGKSLKIVRIT